MIDKQCLLHIGDEIKEINGQKVDAKPDVIQNMLRGKALLSHSCDAHTMNHILILCHNSKTC